LIRLKVLVARGVIPRPLLPQLAEDACSLLATQEFQQYVATLLQQNIWQVSKLREIKRFPPDLSTWQQPALELPVKLSDCQMEKNRGGKEVAEGGYRSFHGNI
jgi:hypothetical protein